MHRPLLSRSPDSHPAFLIHAQALTHINMRAPALISPAQLLALRKGPGSSVILDASWTSAFSAIAFSPEPLRSVRLTRDLSDSVPGTPQSGRELFFKERLPHAQFFDLDEVASEHELGLKHMLPSPERFAKAAGATPRLLATEDHH